MVSHRHAIANNPQMQNYNPEQPTSYLMYLDSNNFTRMGYEPADADRWFPVGKSCACGIAIVFVETSVYIIYDDFMQ